MAEIVPVVSEALEAQVRNLLPSQRGFGEDLQASNVIMPIIDLTAAAEGTNVPLYQQQALAFGSNTSFDVDGTTSTIISTAGFYRIIGSANFGNAGANKSACIIAINDGLGDKQVVIYQRNTTTPTGFFVVPFDVTIFLRSGDSCKIIADVNARMRGSYRQTADVNGVAVNPSGFTPQ